MPGAAGLEVVLGGDCAPAYWPWQQVLRRGTAEATMFDNNGAQEWPGVGRACCRIFRPASSCPR